MDGARRDWPALGSNWEVARRLNSDDRSIRLYEPGLIRSPHRDAGVQEMELLLLDADSPVTEFCSSPWRMFRLIQVVIRQRWCTVPQETARRSDGS